jgi:hypothetical protein
MICGAIERGGRVAVDRADVLGHTLGLGELSGPLEHVPQREPRSREYGLHPRKSLRFALRGSERIDGLIGEDDLGQCRAGVAPPGAGRTCERERIHRNRSTQGGIAARNAPSWIARFA